MGGKSSKTSEKSEVKKGEVAEEKLDKVAGGGGQTSETLIKLAEAQDTSSTLTAYRRRR